VILTAGLAFVMALMVDVPSGLSGRLSAEDPASLGGAARREGDARRGALVFYRPSLGCARCHVTEAGQGRVLGPDLGRIGPATTDVYLVESILEPSKAIARGFEPVTIARADGRVVVGLLDSEDAASVTLRDPSLDGRTVSIPRAEIEGRTPGSVSLMPGGLADQLAGRGEFLDLIRYLREIADGGPDRARQLRPSASEVAPPLPSYEDDLDHAGLIAGLGPDAFARGEAIYARVCVNCHGTKDRPGSLPDSLRFASGRFKNGSDPYRIYRTLTHGYGRMMPQGWMVPRQKYDVIHYLREAYLKPDNPSEFASVDRAYLDRLPKGTSRGPEPSAIEPWSAMDYGPSLSATIEVGRGLSNVAYKGVAIRLDAGPGGVARGRQWALYEHDTMRLAAAWSGEGFVDWESIHFNGKHGVHPRVVGLVRFANPSGPGWANPEDGSLVDPRPLGRDGRPYGPLPRAWAHYRGQHRQGDRVILSSTVGETPVLEMPGLDDAAGSPAITRTIRLGARPKGLTLRVARVAGSSALVRLDPTPGLPDAVALGGPARMVAGIAPRVIGASWRVAPPGDLLLTIPAGPDPLQFTLRLAEAPEGAQPQDLAAAVAPRESVDLDGRLGGGPARWPEVLKTSTRVGRSAGPFAVDSLTLPVTNPWNALIRPTGLDFTPDGRGAYLCTWDGDVWRVDGLGDPGGSLAWRRVASGLFQPLGLKVVDGRVHVGCRDQIARLVDLNGDGEFESYEAFNSDHQVTEHFHEFAMDLQVDRLGNFYYAKGARHGLEAVVPHHGTLLRVGADGVGTEIVATGFRAPNGVRVEPDGTFFLTDQEGFWTPKNRINHVKPGGFYGNLWGFTDATDPADSAMEPPVCWVTNAVDRSPAEVIRVEGGGWGPSLEGSLLNLSYGEGKFYVVPTEVVGGRMQGGVSALPIPSLPTGVMRGRFAPRGGPLYACGMYAWAGNRTDPGGFYRVRRLEKPAYLPIALHARPGGMEIGFSDPIDLATAADPTRYAVKTWTLRRSARYGSEHHDERPSKVVAARPTADGRGVLLELEGFRPVQCMEIRYAIRGEGGEPVEGSIDNTVHQVGEAGGGD